MDLDDESDVLYQVPFFKDKPPDPFPRRRPPPPRRLHLARYSAPLLLLFLAGYFLLSRPRPAPGMTTADIRAAEAAFWSRFAYALYATTPHYLCAAAITLEALHRTGARADRLLLYNDAWGLSPNSFEGRMLVRAMREWGAVLKPVKVVRRAALKVGADKGAKDAHDTWGESLTKLRAWEQIQYDRVLSLDADAVVRGPMDELFALPSAGLAAPRAYWLEGGKLNSQLMLLEPSQEQFLRIIQSETGEGDFDMDVLNRVFANQTLELDYKRYGMLTGELRMTNHSRYVGPPTYYVVSGRTIVMRDPEPWDARKALDGAKYIHFSDWPAVAKPWMESSPKQVKEVVNNCYADSNQDCYSLKLWESIYYDYWRRRQSICKA